jgi:broad specificity phosphatase PhoE
MLNHSLILIRHGEADHNVRKAHNSNPSHPKYFPSHLTAKGRHQALETALRLKDLGYHSGNLSQLLYSPLPRTEETAKVVMDTLGLAKEIMRPEPSLIEIQAGDREGQEYIAYLEEWELSLAKQWNAETNAQVQERVKKIDLTAPFTSILVTHGAPAKELIKLYASENLRLLPGELKIINKLSIA